MAATKNMEQVNKYIIDCIDSEGYDQNPETTSEKLSFLYATFKKEYGHNVKRYGNEINTFAEWCKGLPSSFNCEFRNHAIIEIAKSWGHLNMNATEKQEDKIIDNWFNFIANKTFQLMRRYKII